MKRVLAIVAAVGMVLAALVVRGTFSDGGGGGGDGPDVPDDLTIACPPEVFDTCQQAFGDRAVSQQAGSTLDQIEAGTVEVDAWLVSRAWADVARADAPDQIESVTATGARSPIVIAIWADRREALASGGCERPFGLGCLGDVAGQSFPELNAPFPERVSVGFANLSTMSGFDVVAAGASSFFEQDGFARNDFEPAFRPWLTDFQRDATGTQELLNPMLTFGPARFTAVAGHEATLRPIFEKAADSPFGDVDLLATPVSSELMIVDFAGGRDAAGVATDGILLDALADAGWRVPGKDSPPPLTATDDSVERTDDPENDGMAVKQGVLAALRTLALANG